MSAKFRPCSQPSTESRKAHPRPHTQAGVPHIPPQALPASPKAQTLLHHQATRTPVSVIPSAPHPPSPASNTQPSDAPTLLRSPATPPKAQPSRLHSQKRAMPRPETRSAFHSVPCPQTRTPCCLPSKYRQGKRPLPQIHPPPCATGPTSSYSPETPRTQYARPTKLTVPP